MAEVRKRKRLTKTMFPKRCQLPAWIWRPKWGSKGSKGTHSNRKKPRFPLRCHCPQTAVEPIVPFSALQFCPQLPISKESAIPRLCCCRWFVSAIVGKRTKMCCSFVVHMPAAGGWHWHLWWPVTAAHIIAQFGPAIKRREGEGEANNATGLAYKMAKKKLEVTICSSNFVSIKKSYLNLCYVQYKLAKTISGTFFKLHKFCINFA